MCGDNGLTGAGTLFIVGAEKTSMDVILASRSPRREELLKRIFPQFQIVPSDVDESTIIEGDPLHFAVAAAEAKARDVAGRHPDALVIGADTIVCLGPEVFGKPADRAAAEAMLARLSGRKHRVITGLALYKKDEDKLVTGYEVTYVQFKPLSGETIAVYLDGREYRDKAGSYAIQEIGDAFVEKIEGDYDNVVGFPVKRVKAMLEEWDAPERTLRIEGVDFKAGWAFGEDDGQPILIPGAVVGDSVRARLVWRKPKAGKIVRIEERSPFRVEPLCPHFGECGGCAFQNLEYGKQIELKQTHFEQTMRSARGIAWRDGLIEPILPSPDLFGYRNKMEFAFCGEAGGMKLGLRARSMPGRHGANKSVPLSRCLIFGDAAKLVFPQAIEFANSTGLTPYDPRSAKGYFRNLVLREAKSSGDVMVILVTRSGREIGAADWAARLMKSVPRVKSVWHVENDRVADLVDFESARLLAGEPFIREELGGLLFRVDPETFFQPNPRAALGFYERIAERAREVGARRALGLFCGAGPIELFLARTIEEVVGVDSEERNIANARENATINGAANVRFVHGQVEKAVDEVAFGGFDLLVLDPPREGVRAEGMTRVLNLRVPNVIYMSCNPASLARDLELFAAAGYRLARLLVADFFPHTPHMEALAFLTK